MPPHRNRHQGIVVKEPKRGNTSGCSCSNSYHLLCPRGHSNTPNSVLHGMPPHRNRHQGIVVNLYSPDKDRGVPASGNNHGTTGGDIDRGDFSSVTVATCKQELTRAGAPGTQATIPPP